MKSITRMIITNLKRFKSLDVVFDPKMNVFIGDNESGKSSILLALDLVLSGSRNKVENIGLENLFNKEVIESFLAGAKNYPNLPILSIELYLNEQNNPVLSGANNSQGQICDGLKLIIEPNQDLGREINLILSEAEPNFPFEFYSISFKTFNDEPYSTYSRFLKSILLDSTQINNEYATKEYTTTMFSTFANSTDKSVLENKYRLSKNQFSTTNLTFVNSQLQGYSFGLKSSTKNNFNMDLAISEGGVYIENRGKGRQCFVKTEFALKRSNQGLDVILLEEPENHLSHQNMKNLVRSIEESNTHQLFIATHNNLISSRLDLRKAILLNSNSDQTVLLKDLDVKTAQFFMKAPDNNILEFVLSKKVILIEGNAEFILMEALFKNVTGNELNDSNVHVISVGGLSFKRYLELAKMLRIKTAVIRDNDSNYQENCIDNYTEYVTDNIKIFFDSDNNISTFELAILKENLAICKELFDSKLRSRNLQEYMIAKKAECAFQLLDQKSAQVVAPDYIKRAIEWINQ